MAEKEVFLFILLSRNGNILEIPFGPMEEKTALTKMRIISADLARRSTIPEIVDLKVVPIAIKPVDFYGVYVGRSQVDLVMGKRPVGMEGRMEVEVD